MSHPRKCAPSLLNSASIAPLPLWGFNNRPDRKSQSSAVAAWHTGIQFLANISPGENAHEPDNPPLRQWISHLERMLTSLTTCLFDNKSLTWRECSRSWQPTSSTTNQFFPKRKVIQWQSVMDSPGGVSVRMIKEWDEWSSSSQIHQGQQYILHA